jgi:hypothetical protein
VAARNLISAAEGSGTPRDRLAKMLNALNTLYAGGKNACVLGNLVTGSSRQRLHDRLRETFLLWVAALRKLAVESGIPPSIARSRAEDAVAAVEGALILSGALADPTPFRRALRAIPGDLLGPAGKDQ